uniref:Uncharacterized protein n=1 Tax=Ditylum brightwellii TaxID=49249 RepID=A0A7S4S2Q5_9STRA
MKSNSSLRMSSTALSIASSKRTSSLSSFMIRSPAMAQAIPKSMWIETFSEGTSTPSPLASLRIARQSFKKLIVSPRLFCTSTMVPGPSSSFLGANSLTQKQT